MCICPCFLILFFDYFRHTLRLIFDINWNTAEMIQKNHLVVLINGCIKYMNKKNCKFVKEFSYIKDIAPLPWVHNIWSLLLLKKEICNAEGKFSTLKIYCFLFLYIFIYMS